MGEKGNGQKINEELERAELWRHLSTSAALVGVFFAFLSLCFLVTTENAGAQGAESVEQLVLSPSPPWWALPLLAGGIVLFIVSGALAFYFSGRAHRVRWEGTKIEGENESSL
ncbi:hypothetical protein AKJ51_01610 [candidate division MSBL1 archaeon SCGC-AAA382A20]|uniref:Uncharacterized protein n=1 Tax=candidate division MSBL1 archaeon SCGC-AAA382A20 TaxID=1698280 RepID=A0A133VLG1_9EURY|nr:hypothetical protein AKJ51_01610 [candidate division MSBL1 archaeon SCGC-AAA382A20]